ncbi:DNA repair protein RecN (Recombination protein N) [Amphibacillus marinus]|uniref:DNA repair protein RecN n=1 Tax=Amphibacillus marinus TaxID=872970 RepID=A0A1H8NK21_9BACI|nr:DNA repair protein RecN [Amphibacillus marinus]SEO30081.1 DNA repair protein RecN (Recombination protein N) [Amphibacillus marinus]
MLTELSIKDFAIIDHLTINFNSGLTVLTGETGAGKSIIIDAIQLLSGGRGSVEYIRHGSKKATLEGLFNVDDPKHEVFQIAETYGVETDNDGMFVLHRTISASGKSICRVNGSLITLAILREFGRLLIDIHTQHETQSLMDADRHIQLLDLYSRDEIEEVQKEYQSIYKKLLAVKGRLKHFEKNEQEIIQRLDLLTFQLKELKDAELTPNEDEQLEKERDRLANYDRIFQNVQEAYSALHGERHGLDWLSLALSALETASTYEQNLKEEAEQFSNHFYLVEDIAMRLRQYLDQLEFDPNRLNLIESRLNELNRLMRKYGSSVNEMLEYAAKVEDEIDQLKDRDQSMQQLQNHLQAYTEDAIAEANHLHDIRINNAARLKVSMHKELKDLYLEKAQFQVDISKRITGNVSAKNLGLNGFDYVQFMLSTNPGEPLKPLNKVASGGELSRIMLALKKIFAKHQGVTSVIFDEVDTGVSGRVAQAIAEKIVNIAAKSQVLCITHLPQVAAMADTHILIEKKMLQNSTHTIVSQLEKKQQVEEIARMITGTELTKASLMHANELIEHADTIKK